MYIVHTYIYNMYIHTYGVTITLQDLSIIENIHYNQEMKEILYLYNMFSYIKDVIIFKHR